MEKHTIGGLKKVLVAEPKFYNVMDYFLTLTETNAAFLNESKEGKNKQLKIVILAIIEQICQLQNIVEPDSKIILMNLCMLEVRPRYFWHGSGMINGKNLVTFFYFADLDKGLVSVTKGSRNFFARVTIKAVTTEKNPTESFSDN